MGALMMTLLQRRTPQKRGLLEKLAQMCRLRLALFLWRLAQVLLTLGGKMIKYQFIGQMGMRNIWRLADRLERAATRIKGGWMGI